MAASAATTVTAAPPGAESLFLRVRDGLRLHVRRYGRDRRRRPVLCLPGLTRNGRDFTMLAEALAGDAVHPRTVYALDYRGRGLSDHDPDWKNYTVPVEAQDVVDVMAALDLHGAALIGTSRGGLIAMVLGALQPAAFGPVVLNDIGPVIERDGLVRMVAYVGRVPLPATWEEATELVRGMSEKQFSAVPPQLWPVIARKSYLDENGFPAPAYDARLAQSVSMLSGDVPALWVEFQALSRVPTLVLRGGNSDMLAQRTVDDMLARHARLDAVVIPGEGHTPMLMDSRSIEAIEGFVTRNEPRGGAGTTGAGPVRV